MTKDAVSGRTRSNVRFNEFLIDLKKKEEAKAQKRIAKLPSQNEERACKIEEGWWKKEWWKKRAEAAVVEVEKMPDLEEEIPSYLSPSY